MATKPGVLTDWPWKSLGSFKYILLGPWAIQSLYSVVLSISSDNKKAIDYTNLAIIPFMLSRALHNQIWISFSRHRTAKGNNRILDRGIEFEQVDRESNWDDNLLLQALIYYIANSVIPNVSFLPLWRTDGIIITILLHAGPVEYLYYWLHRSLHHHYLYSRYHSHHHSSIVTEPITSVIHPFAEHIAYFLLFSIPIFGTIFSGAASMASLFGYVTYIDLMNNMGHCNFELVPKFIFSVIPFLKYVMYTPSYHSLHHTQFRTNYALFMPFYDYVHGTMDGSTEELHEASLTRLEEDCPDVVHLTHLTTPESVFHLQVGFASFASRPQNPEPNFWWWPITVWSVVLSCVYGRTFVVERVMFDKLKFQTWAIPRYTIQYSMKGKKKGIKCLIEEAILEAEKRGVRVLSLGLLNQDDELRRNVAMLIEKKELKIKVIDGDGLAVAVVLNSIPKGTTQILFRGNLDSNNIAFAIVSALSHQGIKVATLYENEKVQLSDRCKGSDVFVSEGYDQKIWIVGDGLTEEEQAKAPKGSTFIPYSQFPPTKTRKNDDVFYCHTPSMLAPSSLRNLHSCENWLGRRAMSAWRVAGMVHGLECGGGDDDDIILESNQVWEAAIKHGFRPVIY